MLMMPEHTIISTSIRERLSSRYFSKVTRTFLPDVRSLIFPSMAVGPLWPPHHFLVSFQSLLQNPLLIDLAGEGVGDARAPGVPLAAPGLDILVSPYPTDERTGSPSSSPLGGVKRRRISGCTKQTSIHL